MKKIISLLFILLTYNIASGQIASWDFTGQNNVTSAAATTFDSSLNSSNLITRGTNAGSSTGVNSFRTKGFKNDGISLSNNDYFQITLSASIGYQLSLSSIDASFNGTSTFYTAPGVTSQFAYSLDGSNYILIGSPVTSISLVMDQISLSSISDLQNVPSGKIVTLRYYASGQTATGGWGFYSSSAGSRGLSIEGTVAKISSKKSAKSDIITFPGYSYPQNIDYKKYQADDIKYDSNSIEVAKFTIRDGGNSNDPDSFGTTLNSITFSISNFSNIKRIAIYDGTIEVGTETNSTTLVEIHGLNLTALDGNTKVFSVRISFNSNVTDNQNLKFTIVSAKCDSAGSSFADANAGGALTDNSGDNNKIKVYGDRLIFNSEKLPVSVFQNENFSVQVSAVDINKNIDLNANNSITLSRESGNGKLSSESGLTHNLYFGTYTWTDLQYDTAKPFTIKASAGNLSSVISGFIDSAVSNSSGIKNFSEGLPVEFKLDQNYPNPFNPVTEISYNIPDVSKVLLKVYDLFGRNVVTLVDALQQPGFYKVQFNSQLLTGQLSSGVYFYKLTAGNFESVRKMTLLK